ncbi:uncharacterized protein LOC119724543 [Patiria miniata]|uniref:Protein quiver n=1 Tax=Patiria miniata TaxID=46514 RepID=A0A913ZJQ5_PATMI|nr:uncharacterized protein LOC119724543 [Patiria miniata]
MEKIVFILCLLFCVMGIAKALECYACRDCQPDFKDDKTGKVTEICPKNSQDRHDTLLRCSKHVEKDGKINRGCSTVKDCTVFETISKCSDDTTGNADIIETSCEICCDSNKCNSATMATLSPALCILISLLMALHHV